MGEHVTVEYGCCATLKITTGAAFTMPTKIPANRTARSVKCRPSSARRRERPVVCTPQRASRPPRGVRKTGAICGSPSPGADISHGAESLSVEAHHGRWRPGRYTDLAEERTLYVAGFRALDSDVRSPSSERVVSRRWHSWVAWGSGTIRCG